MHLREDRRHIQDDDVRRMRPLLKTRMNLEMAVTDEMVEFAKKFNRNMCVCTRTTPRSYNRGGLDVVGNFEKLKLQLKL